MRKKLRGYIRGVLRMMSRQKEYYLRNPAEREQRRSLLRALLALPVEGAEAIEGGTLPSPLAIQAAASAAQVSVAVVEEACESVLFFFAPRGLIPRDLLPTPKAD
jgi:hypothetical protein